MERLNFNDNWTYKHLNGGEEPVAITLPHDAMLYEERRESNPGGGNICWFAGGDYLYEKEFTVPEQYDKLHVEFEFEGVYRNARVLLNGQEAGGCAYGYTGFFVDADPFLKYGESNVIQVIARNADQPNSRWYSGSGIYRPVTMHVGPKAHILQNGVKIKTVSIAPAVIAVEVLANTDQTVAIEILDEETTVARDSAKAQNGRAAFQITVPKAKLWDLKNSFLYTCRVSCGEDSVEERFGIRSLQWGREKGLTINGKRVILRGACIHHDNGLLGACCYADAEERKVRLLMENGYNALRSAHNPCSKALLDACDRLGMLVMDEYVDCWYIHKTEYDYVSQFMDNWQFDLKSMVEKDYNHPSVILYSTGNEVSETAQKRGIELTGQMTRYLHSLDDTRPVTCGVNIFFNFLSSIGFGIYSDDKAKKEAEKAKQLQEGAKKKKPVGSEFYNTMAGLLGDTTMKVGATLHGCDVKTRDAFANMDIAGYNYGIFRYQHDLKKYPDRLILGSETFCKDAYLFYRMAKKNPGIIGDFVWAGMDYLGEVGIGAWEYEDYAPADVSQVGWLCAGSGRIDITGKPIGEALYTKTAFGLTDRPAIAVQPVYQRGKHSPSAWKMTNAMESWSFRGCSGYPATVEVYALAAQVELLVNHKSVGRKKFHKNCRFIFKTAYEDGELTAIAYDRQGREIARHSLKTAGQETVLRAIPEKEEIAQGSLAYIRMQYTDEAGIVKPMERGVLTAAVRGGRLLGMGSACPFQKESYLTNTADTYYGEALAIVMADGSGDIVFEVTDGTLTGTAKVRVQRKEHAG